VEPLIANCQKNLQEPALKLASHSGSLLAAIACSSGTDQDFPFSGMISGYAKDLST